MGLPEQALERRLKVSGLGARHCNGDHWPW
jgi:hypothetical protein